MEFIDLKAQYAKLQAGIDVRIRTVLGHGQFVMGPEVAELEERLAARTGCQHCVACSSGTDALLIALMALGVGQGDEVVEDGLGLSKGKNRREEHRSHQRQAHKQKHWNGRILAWHKQSSPQKEFWLAMEVRAD